MTKNARINTQKMYKEQQKKQRNKTFKYKIKIGTENDNKENGIKNQFLEDKKMKTIAIKQIKSSRNIHFITDEYNEYDLDEIPDSKNEMYSRGNFFIHGGNKSGSERCIDLVKLNQDFHVFMRLYHRNFKLIVRYK
jgi:hypothetical protein